MLDFYTDLNNARKERDDKYVEDAYLGEEVIEPDEKDQPWANDIAGSSDKKDNLYDSGKDEDTTDMLADLKEEIKNEEGDEENGMDMGEKIGVATTEVIEQWK